MSASHQRPALTHLALHTVDVHASRSFYEQYCGMRVVRERPSTSSAGSSGNHAAPILWMAEPGRETDLIFVLLPGGEPQPDRPRDYSHIGFALESRAAVDAIATRARSEGCLSWEPVEDDYPAGYYCGVRDPSGNVIEFSYGQPLGPGAPEAL